MYELLIAGYLIIAVVIVILVLIQHGKGADMGSSFGAGASATLFGSSGSGNFLTRTTTILGVLFFAISIILSNLGSGNQNLKVKESNGEFNIIQDNVPAVTQQNTNKVDPTTDSVTQPTSTNPTSDIPE
ncbi:preprotein translocase subunit SecG [uncultured Gilliamella sp.]|uniref:preprotein translocase subunit SecG n=1 Tax=uncultured Gilliamella sp. TaxID=1193505 RepID=UPI0025FDBB82|nr:preprotein translocase subunit SecG [uncultured Gilliamella sp.]